MERTEEEVLAELIRFQDELPASWRGDDVLVVPDEEWTPLPDFTGLTIDMRKVWDSWKDQDDDEEDYLLSRVDDPIPEYAGSEPGMYPPDYLETLRAEWPD